jgi:hypothetical protein
MMGGIDLSGAHSRARRPKIEIMPHRTFDDWRLREWMAHFGKIQADLSKELGWTKNRAHVVWHGTQPYRREIVNEVAAWLGIKPFELLMLPREALALRRMRENAAVIVSDRDAPPL